jgi:hypothetical protein
MTASEFCDKYQPSVSDRQTIERMYKDTELTEQEFTVEIGEKFVFQNIPQIKSKIEKSTK